MRNLAKLFVKIAPIFVLALIVLITLTSSSVDAGTMRAYYVIHDGKVENLIRLDSDLVPTWFDDDPSRTLVLVTRNNHGRVGDEFDETKPDEDVRRFISPTAEPLSRAELLEIKILAGTDTYSEFREYVILELKIE